MTAVNPKQTMPAVLKNPFHIGGRINDPSHFYGRKRLMREVQQTLNNNSKRLHRWRVESGQILFSVLPL